MKKQKHDNLPRVTVLGIEEKPDGSILCEFEYDMDFENVVKKELKLDRRPTEKEVGDFILKGIEQSFKTQKKPAKRVKKKKT